MAGIGALRAEHRVSRKAKIICHLPFAIERKRRFETVLKADKESESNVRSPRDDKWKMGNDKWEMANFLQDHTYNDQIPTPGIVKLYESPGRA